MSNVVFLIFTLFFQSNSTYQLERNVWQVGIVNLWLLSRIGLCVFFLLAILFYVRWSEFFVNELAESLFVVRIVSLNKLLFFDFQAAAGLDLKENLNSPWPYPPVYPGYDAALAGYHFNGWVSLKFRRQQQTQRDTGDKKSNRNEKLRSRKRICFTTYDNYVNQSSFKHEKNSVSNDDESQAEIYYILFNGKFVRQKKCFRLFARVVVL